jgi:uncharacterized membrane protein YdcZ (DUF606 family)
MLFGAAANAEPGSGAARTGPVPMFARLHTINPDFRAPPGGPLPTWTFNWTYSGTPYAATMVGATPTTTATTVPAYVIPITIVVSGKKFSPLTLQSNSQTALADTVNSPIFSSGVDFVQGGTDLGSTQYIDAVQRGNFWSSVSANPGWHLLAGGPTVLKIHTITVPAADGKLATAFGVKVALVNINWIDGQFQALLTADGIPADAIATFMTYNTYLTNGSPTLGNCCIGGYHNYNGSLAYEHFTYINKPGAFSQDVSALSHELGEWANDPFTNNNSPCGILEVGDPLEGTANYGDYTYTLGGFAYHLQDLVWMPYFGAPASTSLLNRSTFQGTALSVCQNGA